MINFDLLNFIIAVLALLTAIYSIFYTHHQNRHRITISSGERYYRDDSPTMHCFEISNVCPSPVTLLSINFTDPDGNIIIPADYEPEPNYMEHIPDFMYSNPLSAPCLLQPYENIECGYYFSGTYDEISITITCDERIHNFKKTKSFSVHFSDVYE